MVLYNPNRLPLTRQPLAGEAPPFHVTGRARLPGRRFSESFGIEVSGLKYTATVSRYPDGAIGELFLSNHKSNSTAGVNARDAGRLLVCGPSAPVEKIRRALCRHADGTARGPLGVALNLIFGQER